MKTPFYDLETGKELVLEIRRMVWVGEQQWAVGNVRGVDWAVPVGWPNAASPICRESEPEAYQEVANAS